MRPKHFLLGKFTELLYISLFFVGGNPLICQPMVIICNFNSVKMAGNHVT